MPKWLLALVLVLISCTTAAPRVVPPDRSLTLEAYQQLGVPPHDRRWTGADVVQAVTALEKAVASQGPGILPRRGSARSGQVFARLTSVDNLVPFGDPTLPLAQRVEPALAYFQASNQVLKLYLQAFRRRGVGDSEMVDLMGVMLRSAVTLQKALLEVLATLDPNDPSYAVRMDGVEQWKVGNAQMLGGGLITLGERSAYRTEELARLIDYMLETFPVLVPSLLPEGQKLIVERLEALVDDPKMVDLRSKMLPLVEKVKAAAKP